MKKEQLYNQVNVCAETLERVDMQLHDLYATQFFLGDAMGQYSDECSRVFSLLNCVIEDIRASIGEAMGCAMKARGYLEPSAEGTSA